MTITHLTVGKHLDKVDVTADDPTGFGHPTVLLVQRRDAWTGNLTGAVKAVTGYGYELEIGERLFLTLDTRNGYRDLNRQGAFEVVGRIIPSERTVPTGCPKRVPGYFLD